MSFEPRDYLRHIAAEADYLLERSALLTFDTFSQDERFGARSCGAWRSSARPPRKVRTIFGRSIRMWRGGRWPACATGSFTTTSALTTIWSGTSCAIAFQNSARRSQHYLRPNPQLEPTRLVRSRVPARAAHLARWAGRNGR